jgi:hypothetical protein
LQGNDLGTIFQNQGKWRWENSVAWNCFPGSCPSQRMLHQYCFMVMDNFLGTKWQDATEFFEH